MQRMSTFGLFMVVLLEVGSWRLEGMLSVTAEAHRSVGTGVALAVRLAAVARLRQTLGLLFHKNCASRLSRYPVKIMASVVMAK